MTETKTSSSSWRIPPPIQHVFEHFPLHTYPPNELPDRCPPTEKLPILNVFISEDDARRGLPSFNPSCLKWQTFLRIAKVKVHLAPSNNHASPSGSLPFLQIPSQSTAPDALPTTISSSKLHDYALKHQHRPVAKHEAQGEQEDAEAKDNPATRKEAAYIALLNTPVRNAWLYALYLSPRNTPLLRRLYIEPATNSTLVQKVLLHQLRTAAREEILKSTTGATTGNVDVDGIYDAAQTAFAALETLLSNRGRTRKGNEDEDEDEDVFDNDDKLRAGSRQWFSGGEEPNLFDASVFAYTHLILRDDDEWTWEDDKMRNMVLQQPRLVAHAKSLLGHCWS